jgi:2,4-dienoyl-CoA reductase-like NADH-dependent reductase (Old Yellow Enzyme family)
MAQPSRTISTRPTDVLFTPYTLGDLQLKNRIVMAPLTRTRADNRGKVPNELMAAHYAQRAGAGLIITEGTLSNDAAPRSNRRVSPGARR